MEGGAGGGERVTLGAGDLSTGAELIALLRRLLSLVAELPRVARRHPATHSRIGGQVDRRAPGLQRFDLLARVLPSAAGEQECGEERNPSRVQGFSVAAALSFFAFSPFASWRAFRL